MQVQKYISPPYLLSHMSARVALGIHRFDLIFNLNHNAAFLCDGIMPKENIAERKEW